MTRHATAGAMGVSLAHQISQPLSNVAMYLHVGRQLLADKPAETAPIAASLEKATGQLRQAKEILERLRDFVSRGTLRPAPTDLGALTRKVVALAEDDARAHGVSVRLEAASVPPVTVDALQLEQSLINVINNAIDAAAEAGRLPGCVTVRVAARDKGCGSRSRTMGRAYPTSWRNTCSSRSSRQSRAAWGSAWRCRAN